MWGACLHVTGYHDTHSASSVNLLSAAVSTLHQLLSHRGRAHPRRIMAALTGNEIIIVNQAPSIEEYYAEDAAAAAALWTDVQMKMLSGDTDAEGLANTVISACGVGATDAVKSQWLFASLLGDGEDDTYGFTNLGTARIDTSALLDGFAQLDVNELGGVASEQHGAASEQLGGATSEQLGGAASEQLGGAALEQHVEGRTAIEVDEQTLLQALEHALEQPGQPAGAASEQPAGAASEQPGEEQPDEGSAAMEVDEQPGGAVPEQPDEEPDEEPDVRAGFPRSARRAR